MGVSMWRVCEGGSGGGGPDCLPLLAGCLAPSHSVAAVPLGVFSPGVLLFGSHHKESSIHCLLGLCEKLGPTGASRRCGGAPRDQAYLRLSRWRPCASAWPLTGSITQSESVPQTRSPFVPHGMWRPYHHQAARSTGPHSTPAEHR